MSIFSNIRIPRHSNRLGRKVADLRRRHFSFVGALIRVFSEPNLQRRICCSRQYQYFVVVDVEEVSSQQASSRAGFSPSLISTICYCCCCCSEKGILNHFSRLGRVVFAESASTFESDKSRWARGLHRPMYCLSLTKGRYKSKICLSDRQILLH